ERQRRDEEIERQVLEAELDRRGLELEEARKFQLSMLPQSLPRHESFELAARVETAAEVGGDYHDFHLSEDGRLTLAVGDATGHGARAGTMVTVIKSLFSARSASEGPGEFLTAANHTIRRMNLGRMTMALTVLSLEDRRIALACAGMPPLLHHQARSGEVREVLLPGMPLGGLAREYREVDLELAGGDTLLLYSDGLAEQPRDGEPVGYGFVQDLFRRLAVLPVPEVCSGLTSAFAELTEGAAPEDDMTFVVLRVR
ncbi:MAG: SpoIIE family protein phosphatase, partial [Acidobacteriota bacterium]